jgi:voltage-gated sodium channel
MKRVACNLLRGVSVAIPSRSVALSGAEIVGDIAIAADRTRSLVVSASRLARLMESLPAQIIVVALILGNALQIGLETYGSFADRHRGILDTADRVLLTAFTIELALRFIACGGRPARFLRSGWNVFDLVIVVAAYLPWIRESITLLRLARLLRVSRLVAVVPSLRTVVAGIVKSFVPLASVAGLTFLLLYVYAVLGWMLFGDHDPQRFGSAGTGLMTLFQLLTLEGWNDVLAAEQGATPWAWAYFVSFILLGSFLVLNVVIAIVISSVEEARAEERRIRAAESPWVPALALAPAEPTVRMRDVYEALVALRTEVAALRDGGGAHQIPSTRPAAADAGGSTSPSGHSS